MLKTVKSVNTLKTVKSGRIIRIEVAAYVFATMLFGFYSMGIQTFLFITFSTVFKAGFCQKQFYDIVTHWYGDLYEYDATVKYYL